MWFRLAVGLIIICRITLFGYFVITEGNYIHPDTGMYIDLARNLFENHEFVIPSPTPDYYVQSGDAPFGPQVFRTPGYPFFLALLSAMGMQGPYWAVFWQEIIYAVGAYLFYHYGRSVLGLTMTRLGLFFLLLDPGGLAFPKLLISETLFLPFLVLGVVFIGRYLHSFRCRDLLFAGLIMGVGALIRPAIIYFPLVAAAAILFFHWRHAHYKRHVAIMLLAFMLVLSPWLIRNYVIFNKLFVSGQTSNMLAFYHVPRVLNAAGVLGYYEAQQYVREKVATERQLKEKKLGRLLDGIEFFQLQQQVALQYLIKYPGTYFTQWIHGSLKGMYVPFLMELHDVFGDKNVKLPFLEIMPELIHAEQPGILGFKVSAFTSRLLYYLQNQNRFYLLFLVINLMIVLGAGLGVFPIIKAKDCFLWVMLLANFYFICLPGPMGYARFRFPVGVFWFLQAYLGYVWLWSWVRGKWEPGYRIALDKDSVPGR